RSKGSKWCRNHSWRPSTASTRTSSRRRRGLRPLRLQVKGFTAFRDPVEVDFTELDVFAISGPTGSGKSSLLDAMTYALFGRVERVGAAVGQLVSQGQPRMAVTLEFEVGAERYRVTRSTPVKGATRILLERQAPG